VIFGWYKTLSGFFIVSRFTALPTTPRRPSRSGFGCKRFPCLYCTTKTILHHLTTSLILQQQCPTEVPIEAVDELARPLDAAVQTLEEALERFGDMVAHLGEVEVEVHPGEGVGEVVFGAGNNSSHLQGAT
jgi:hypothetical protein